MSEIHNVVLVGTGGAIGPHVLSALSKSSFNVTVFTRSDSKTTLPSGVKSVIPEYDSIPALTSALKGQDALVSTLGGHAPHIQTNLIKAAIAAGVKRIIPSEFGSDTTNAKVRSLPLYKDKVATQELLAAEAAQGKVTYSLIISGPILDWGLMAGFLLDVKGKKAELYDGGDRRFSATTGANIGNAVVQSLVHAEKTKNRPVYVQDAVVTQNQLIELAKGLGQTGSWETKVVETEAMEKSSYAELEKLRRGEAADPGWIYGFIKTAIWGEGCGAEFTKTDNELLGVKGLSEKDLAGLVKTYI